MRMLNYRELGEVAGRGLEEVEITARRYERKWATDYGAGGNADGSRAASAMAMEHENFRPEDPRADEESSVKKEVDKKTKEIAEKLEEVTVEAQKCGISLSTLFNFTTGESGAVWKDCFKNLPQNEKENLRDALTVIAAGFALEKSLNPIKIAVNTLMHDERLMLAELAKSLSANDGWWFGENLATLSKGGWDSQLVLKLIQSVFRVNGRGG